MTRHDPAQLRYRLLIGIATASAATVLGTALYAITALTR